MKRMPNPGAARKLAWSAALLPLALTLATVALDLAAFAAANRPPKGAHDWFGSALTLTYAMVGALVAIRQPRNPIGWIFTAVGFLFGMSFLAKAYTILDAYTLQFLPGVQVAVWLNMWLWIPATLLPLTFVLLLFPDGQLPSPRWWPIRVASTLAIVTYLLSVALHPRPPITPIPELNPYGLPNAGPWLNALGWIAGPLILLGVFGSMAALIARFRRARGLEREQLKWLAYAAVMGIAVNVGINLWSSSNPSSSVAYEISLNGISLALIAIALAAGVAILRYRLYDINLTLVYGALTAAIAALYGLVVGGLGVLLQARGSLALSLLAVVVTAIAAQPVRDRLQRAVNHLMYGDRDDPYAVLSRLGQRLETTLAAEAVLPTIVETVAQALRLPYAAIQVQQGEALHTVVEHGSRSGEPLWLPLTYQGAPVGQLVLSPRAPGEVFSAADRRLLDDLARQAGVAAHAVGLTTALQRSRERLVAAREEERRRLRRDLHDGLGPQLASLSLNLEMLRNRLGHDPAAQALLEQLVVRTQAAVADIRRLVYALRPPALDELGLVQALRETMAQYRQPSLNGLRLSLEAPEELPPLPAAVEVAAYRIAQEALTNVVRHADGSQCVLRLALDPAGGWLCLEVQDDGRGLPPLAARGVGLASMRERADELGGQCTVETAQPRGTLVRARLPCHPAAPVPAAEPEAPLKAPV
jgi:two-component system NarL family sensor kinase